MHISACIPNIAVTLKVQNLVHTCPAHRIHPHPSSRTQTGGNKKR